MTTHKLSRRAMLRGLGVTGEDDRVHAGMEAKYRQIHRFIELLGPLLDDAGLPSDRPAVAYDMGCGKGYLTFALFEHLRSRGGRPARVHGVEVRGELCDAGNRIVLLDAAHLEDRVPHLGFALLKQHIGQHFC